MIGRKKEIERINRLLQSERSEFLAITGRRRVGKTFLIDTMLREHYCFNLTGIQNGNLKTQLLNFAVKLSEFNGTSLPLVPENWQMAFLYLKNYLKTLDKDKKHVIFIDELPWIATAKSNFVQFLAHFWNDYLSKEPNFILVICGSATSWITQKIINDTGGLHNRVTENIHLYPFTIGETTAFLQQKGLQFTLQEAIKIYMSLGGIPFYLENIRKGESFAVAIERLCFSPNGALHNEYDNLFKALFNNAEVHQQIVATLAAHPSGLSHGEILDKMNQKQSNGSYQRAIDELIVSDFVTETTPFGKKKRGVLYRLTDEYSIFYHRFIKPSKKYTQGMWQQLAESQAYKIWSGFAFENFCHKHIDAIKQTLGISAVFTEIYSLAIPANETAEGVQIDLLIDRKDASINLCEIKFHNAPFTISKAYYQQLLAKRARFIAHTGTKKQVFITFISNHGLTQNAYAKEIIDAEIRLAELV
jgi:uncharacterized protein